MYFSKKIEIINISPSIPKIECYYFHSQQSFNGRVSYIFNIIMGASFKLIFRVQINFNAIY